MLAKIRTKNSTDKEDHSYHRINDGELNAVVRESAGSRLHWRDTYKKERKKERKKEEIVTEWYKKNQFNNDFKFEDRAEKAKFLPFITPHLTNIYLQITLKNTTLHTNIPGKLVAMCPPVSVCQ